jgi:hypothetical protein
MRLQIDVHVEALADIAGEPLERRLKAQVVEHAGAQAEREISDGSEHLVHEMPALDDGSADLGVGGKSGSFDSTEFHAKGREYLAHVVVQLSRKVPPFLFLSRDQTLRELPHLALGFLGYRTLLV